MTTARITSPTKEQTMKELSLNQTLEDLGLTTRPASKTLARKEGSKHVLRGDEILFTGTAGDTWAWLGARADIVAAEGGFWCKATARVATSGSPRFDGFQAAAADHFPDENESSEWLRLQDRPTEEKDHDGDQGDRTTRGVGYRGAYSRVAAGQGNRDTRIPRRATSKG